MDFDKDSLDAIMLETSLEDWVIDKRDQWRDHYESNYEETFDEYYRLWRAIWEPQDRQRKSERSRIISPALQQAVESSVAEVEEATFGRGKWFDLSDDIDDPEKEDIQYLRNKLQYDFDKSKARKAISECILNSAVFGTGIGEIVLEDVKEMVPASRPTFDGQLTEIGVEIRDKIQVRIRPIMPKQFLIDPVATSVEDALGVMIDEFVPRHQVEILQDQGIYRDTPLEDASPDTDIEPDDDLTVFNDDKIRLTKYYGKVPREMLKEVADVEDGDDRYVEAIIVVANDGTLLKAEANPYMMQDRPVVAFQWDLVPGRFHGRGICEKGYMSQKALDTEMRARIDALSLIVHPMLAVDATRLPRGFKPEVRPGKIIMTQGNPSEVLQPFNFGQMNPASFNQTGELQSMVQQATGAVDSTGLLSSISGDTKAGAVSMSLGAVIKRHKRTLINFQESFLIPFIEKTAWRYMQFDPDNYPVQDYKFKATSTLGIIAREYEVSQLISLLQTMSAESPMYPALIQSIVENMNLSNREDLVAILKEAGTPDPEAQAAAKAMQEAQMDFQLAQTETLRGEAKETSARSVKLQMETQLMPKEVEAKIIRASTVDLENNRESQDFRQRLEILDRRLKEKELNIKEMEAKASSEAKVAQTDAALEKKLMERLGVAGGGDSQ